jgi:DNA-binding beta-propeller fold protein YncE
MSSKTFFLCTCWLFAVSCIAPDTGDAPAPVRDSFPVDEIWICNTLGESVSVCNADRFAAGTAPWMADNCLLTGSAPNRIGFFAGQGWIIDSYGNSLTRFSPDTARVTGTINLGTGHNPWEAAFFTAGDGTHYALVTAFLSDRLLVVDLAAAAPVAVINITPPAATDYRPRPEGVAVMGNRAYITCTGWDFSAGTFREGFLAVLDLAGNDPAAWTNLSYHQTATNPQAVLPVPTRAEVHILATGRNGENEGLIQVFATNTMALVTNIPCGGSPHRFAPAADGRTWLAGGDSLLRYDRFTLVLDHDNSAPLYRGTGETWLAAATFATNSGRLYLLDFTQDRLLELDPDTGAVLRETATGDGPVDIVCRRQF